MHHKIYTSYQKISDDVHNTNHRNVLINDLIETKNAGELLSLKESIINKSKEIFQLLSNHNNSLITEIASTINHDHIFDDSFDNYIHQMNYLKNLLRENENIADFHLLGHDPKSDLTKDMYEFKNTQFKESIQDIQGKENKELKKEFGIYFEKIKKIVFKYYNYGGIQKGELSDVPYFFVENDRGSYFDGFKIVLDTFDKIEFSSPAHRKFVILKTFLHELYHSTNKISYGMNITSREGDDINRGVFVNRQGLGYSPLKFGTEGNALEEGVVYYLENESHKNILDLIDEGKDKDLLIKSIDGGDDYGHGLKSSYIGAHNLFEFLIKKIPNYLYLVEETRIQGKTLQLARKVEEVLGTGTFKEIVSFRSLGDDEKISEFISKYSQKE